MIFCHPVIGEGINVLNGCINTLVIENRRLFLSLISDINAQMDGQKGDSVLGKNDETIPFSKYCELLSSFVPFDINQKALITKIVSSIEKVSQSASNYEKTLGVLNHIETYLQDVVSAFDCELSFSKISSSSLIKSAGIEIVDCYETLSEKLLAYFELVREFDRDKLFVTVNLRSYIDDEEMERLTQTLILHEYQILMIENREYHMLSSEKRITVDEDLCVF